MKKFKKLFTLMLALCLMVGVFSVPAQAAETPVKYRVKSRNVEVKYDSVYLLEFENYSVDKVDVKVLKNGKTYLQASTKPEKDYFIFLEKGKYTFKFYSYSATGDYKDSLKRLSRQNFNGKQTINFDTQYNHYFNSSTTKNTFTLSSTSAVTVNMTLPYELRNENSNAPVTFKLYTSAGKNVYTKTYEAVNKPVMVKKAVNLKLAKGKYYFTLTCKKGVSSSTPKKIVERAKMYRAGFVVSKADRSLAKPTVKQNNKVLDTLVPNPRTEVTMVISSNSLTQGVDGGVKIQKRIDNNDWKTIETLKSSQASNGKVTFKHIYSKKDAFAVAFRVQAFEVGIDHTKYSDYATSPTYFTGKKLAVPIVKKISQAKQKVTFNFGYGKNADGMVVYMSKSPEGTLTKIGTTTSGSFTTSKLTKGKKYYFAARAFKVVAGKTIYSDFVEQPSFWGTPIPNNRIYVKIK